MLQFITHTTDTFDEVSGAELALAGGCRWIQLRMKDATPEEVVAKARLLLPLCRRFGAKLILDDHVSLVHVTGADGVHLGKNDMPLAQARDILGKNAIIGATANTLEDMKRAIAGGADYIGLGPFRFTKTKKNLSPMLGLEGYRSIMNEYLKLDGAVPVVAIGGITEADVESLMESGISGVAVSGTILRAASPVEVTKNIIEKINKSKI
ncbi:MAG: thiamine phosphate synthase [Muribaculaceae bacterium]|nr:thiamine phosphate synthase [Muribaculaceae bacterium]